MRTSHVDVGERRHVLQAQGFAGEQRGDHQRQGGVLGARDRDGPVQALPPDDANAIHACSTPTRWRPDGRRRSAPRSARSSRQACAAPRPCGGAGWPRKASARRWVLAALVSLMTRPVPADRLGETRRREDRRLVGRCTGCDKRATFAAAWGAVTDRTSPWSGAGHAWQRL